MVMTMTVETQYRTQVNQAVGVMSMEFENNVQKLLHDNQYSGRSVEAQIAVENTIKMMSHMHHDLSSYHFGGLS